jgi:hypothetical protein
MTRILFVLWLFIPVYGISQNAKLKTGKIEIAVYMYNPQFSSVSNKADIVLYYLINKNGNVQVQYQNDSIHEIYNFDLPENVISDINIFFKDKKGLKDCRESGMPEKGVIYGAQEYKFIRIVGGDNKVESACYLDEFMIESFNKLILEITNLYADKTPVNGSKAIITPEIIKQISNLHKQTKYLAKSSEPPPQIEIR